MLIKTVDGTIIHQWGGPCENCGNEPTNSRIMNGEHWDICDTCYKKYIEDGVPISREKYSYVGKKMW